MSLVAREPPEDSVPNPKKNYVKKPLGDVIMGESQSAQARDETN